MKIPTFEDDLPTFLKILETPSTLFENDDDIKACEKIVEELDDKDIDILANSSYAYWLVSKLTPEQLPKEARKNAIMKEIRRHYMGESRKLPKVMASIQGGIELRKEVRVDLVRLCFNADLQQRWGLTEQEEKLVRSTEQMIKDEQRKQQMIVRGSLQSSPVFFKPRRETPTNAEENEAYIITQLYMSERAFAVAEFNTEATVEKMYVVFYFKDYMSGHSVTSTASKTAVSHMTTMYPETLRKLFLCDAPFFMRMLIFLILSFVSAATKAKVQLIVGVDKLVDIIADLAGDPNDKVVQMLREGNYSSSADDEKFLSVVPFHRYYDDVM